MSTSNVLRSTSLICVAILFGITPMRAEDLTSPDGKTAVSIGIRQDGTPVYSVSVDGKPLIGESGLGLVLKDAPPLQGGFQIAASKKVSHDETWKPPYGERASIPDRYNEVLVNFQERTGTKRLLQITFRAYNEGVAFRYTLPKQPGLERVTITGENSTFALPEKAEAYVTTFAQGLYTRMPIADMAKPTQSKPGFTDPGNPAERPLTVALADGRWLSIAEAQMIDYSRMRLATRKDLPNSLVSQLAGPVTATLPLETPWRVLIIGNQPGELLERNYLLLNLNPPCAIADTSWIKPGKVFRSGLSTDEGKASIDFAAARNLQYIEFDAGWYGPEMDDKSDATRIGVDPKTGKLRDIDMQEVIRYGKEKGIGLILYVNRRALERQLDTLLPLYEKWGVAGIKFGFVRVGSQDATRWMHEAVKKCAKHHLLVDIHDEYRPTGFSRTYPNLMTQEGLLGNEGMPTASHNCTLPFTRFVAGAADYTVCYYSPRILTTHAHQLALAAICYSPLQFIYWYDKPSDYKGEPEIAFFDAIPTVWDDTRVLQGFPGDFITVARQAGREWFVGTITNEEPRTLDVPLRFLGEGKYVAHLYQDEGADTNPRTKVSIRRTIVTANTTIKAALKSSGGQAIRLVPASPADLNTVPPYAP